MADEQITEQESDESKQEAILTAALVRETLQTEGMKRIRAKIAELTGRAHSKWLLATPEEAEKIRSQAYGYEMFFDLAKRMMVSGDMAKQILERKTDDRA
jgi:hypothetical protein